MMSDNITALAKEHHVFYEVLPYYIAVEERHGSLAPKIQKVQAGFDVDVYFMKIKDELDFPEADPDYVRGEVLLQEIAQKVSDHTSGSCFLEIISFPETTVFDTRQHNAAEGMFRIRISHRRGLDQPAGEPEEHALAEVENQLSGRGIRRR